MPAHSAHEGCRKSCHIEIVTAKSFLLPLCCPHIINKVRIRTPRRLCRRFRRRFFRRGQSFRFRQVFRSRFFPDRFVSTIRTFAHHLQFHARSDLLILLFGSRFAFSPVSFSFIPDILAQNDALRPASFSVLGCGAGGLRLCPSALADARPFAFRPPFGFLPSALCHAGVFAIRNPSFLPSVHGKSAPVPQHQLHVV